jgi:aldehyde oxidoreductase
VDLGQGSDEAMAIVAAEVLGVERGRIHVLAGDTRRDPQGWMTTASRQTFVSGNAVLNASRDLRRRMWSYVADEFHLSPERIVLRAGHFLDVESGRTLLSLADLAMEKEEFVAEDYYDAPPTDPVPADRYPVSGHPTHKLHFAYSFGVQGAMVAVKEATGQVRVLKIVAAHDAGRAISRDNVIGQIEGGVVQGIGYALSEEFRLEGGYPTITKMADLGLPTIEDLPEIEVIVIENPHPGGPLGAKGMGELPVAPTAPTIVNAIHDAVGVWINELPATPERVLAALRIRK